MTTLWTHHGNTGPVADTAALKTEQGLNNLHAMRHVELQLAAPGAAWWNERSSA